MRVSREDERSPARRVLLDLVSNDGMREVIMEPTTTRTARSAVKRVVEPKQPSAKTRHWAYGLV